MRIRAGLTQFTVVTRDGRSRQVSWLWLAPLLAVPAIAVVALAFFGDPLVGETLRRARWQPSARAEALDLFLHTNRVALENLVAAKPPLAQSDLPTLRLDVPKNTLDALQKALREGDPLLGHEPGGDQPYFDATLTEDDGEVQLGQICLRGLSAWHHHPEKPSLRFKVRKDDVRDRRYVELSRPEDALALKNWIPDRLAAGLGLMSDFGDHVRVFVNNKYFGVYLRSLRADEDLALRNRRMPGSFFKGEFRDDWSRWEKEKAFADLWGTSATGWRSSVGDADANWKPFRRFLDVLREERTPESLAHLEEALDMEVYAKWAAVMIVTGSSHTDGFHNQVFFLDPNHGRLEAVPWDSNAYGMHSDERTPPDLVLHPVMELAISDPRWVHRRNQLIHQLLRTSASKVALNGLIDSTLNAMLPDLEADTHLSSLELMPDLIPWSVRDIEPKRDEIKTWAARRHDFLSAYLSDARVFVEASSERPGFTLVEVAGSVAVTVARTDGADPQADTYVGTPNLLYPGLCASLSEHVSTPFKKSSHKSYAPAAPLAYFVRGTPAELRFTNAITGEPVTPSSGRFDGARCETRTIHPSRIAAPKTGDVVLGPGEVLLREDVRVGTSERLIVLPGTRLKLGAGVGIYARGQTLVLGTSEAPVELLPADAKPWACFGVSGSAASGSRFEHLIAVGGSTGKDGGIAFKGMLDVYEVPEVTLRACRFFQSALGGAAVNIASSRIVVEGCEWNDAPGVALDLDLCTAVLRGCRWRNSGGDGLNLMASDVVVEDCVFEGCRDKGIRAGEGTWLGVRDSEIANCTIGVESVDRSYVEVVCTRLAANGISVQAEHRRWQYGAGGFVALVSCTLESELADLVVGKRSRTLLLDTPLRGFCEGVERIGTTGSPGGEWKAFLEHWHVRQERGEGLVL